jgi:adenosylhomocysteine nucleosidase
VQHRQLLILTALGFEARAVRRAIGNVRGVEVQVIGLGASRLPPISAEACVVVAGLGGALDPTLAVGELVIDTPLAGLPATLPWRVGSIHTSAKLATTPAEKADLFRETGALAVDMEQAIVRRSAPAGLRVVGVRAISDPADMAIDPAVLGFIDDTGRPRPLAIMGTLGRRPKLIGHALKLNFNSRKALHNLGLGVAALVVRFVHTGRLD